MTHRLAASIRSGDWLERERLLVYPGVILAITVAATVYVLMTNGGALPNGSPFGSDFVSFWVAAREALAGHPDTPYLADRFAAVQDAIFGDGNFYAFYYPPHYLAYMLPFGALPYHAALAAWCVAGFAFAYWAVTRIVGSRMEVFVLMLAFPATFLTVAHGQNAFLSAALFGGGLAVLRTRPVLAGVFFGLLTFKPQLGLLVPLALLAGGHWRTILSAALTTALAAALSAALFGYEVWALFLAQSTDAMTTLHDGLVGWNKMISTYAMLRLSGLAHEPAMAAQAVISVAVAVAVFLAWLPRSGVPLETRAAMLLTGALLATPFGLNYDLFLLAPAIAFAVALGMRQGFAPFEKTILAIVYLSPAAVLWLMADQYVIAPFVLGLLFLQLAARAFSRRETGVQPASAAAE